MADFQAIDDRVAHLIAKYQKSFPTVPTSFFFYNERVFCLHMVSSTNRRNTIYEIDVRANPSTPVPEVVWHNLIPDDFSSTTDLSEAQKLIMERSRNNASGVITLEIDATSGAGFFTSGSSIFAFDLSKISTGNTIIPFHIADDVLDPKLRKLADEKTGIFYVKDHELFLATVSWMQIDTVQLTKLSDEACKIVACAPNFIVQEEFDRYTGYYVNPCGDKILVEVNDESMVETLHVDGEAFQYSRAGTKNATQTLAIVSRLSESQMDTDQVCYKMPYHVLRAHFPFFEYITRFGWLNDATIWLELMDRHQKRRVLALCNFESFQLCSDKTRFTIALDFSYTTNNWHEVDYCFQPRTPSSFVYGHQRSGFRHLYLQNYNPDTLELAGHPLQLTTGDWDVNSGDGDVWLSRANPNQLYFKGRENSTLYDHLYVVDVSKACLGHRKDGTFDVETLKNAQTRVTAGTDEENYFYSDFTIADHPSGGIQYLAVASNNYTPHFPILVRPQEPTIELGKKQAFSPADQPLPEPFVCKAADGVTDLHGFIYKPTGYDPSKSYPLFWYVYGGPGVQIVRHNYQGARHMRFKVLADLGYFVVMVDNRGSAGRGQDFQSPLYHLFGAVEQDDQVAAVKQVLSSASYGSSIDPSRIAIFGWSYGGYMSLLAMAEHADIFKLGFCGAAPTDWALYDTAYTERFLDTPQNNPMGYLESGVIAKVPKMPNECNRLFIFHGLRDDNVYFENTKDLIKALQDNRKPYELQMYPTERHGLRSASTFKHNLVYMIANMQKFL